MARYSLSNGVSDFIETVVTIRRVTKVTKGGRKFKLSAWVVVGDGKGRVGIGHGKAVETPEAIRKATQKAYKDLKKVVILKGTVPHEVIGKMGATKVLIKPAAPGTGIIACQPVRAVLEAAGYENALTKSLGANNAVNLLKATLNALTQLKSPEEVAKARGVPVNRVLRRYRSERQMAEDHAGEVEHRQTQEG